MSIPENVTNNKNIAVTLAQLVSLKKDFKVLFPNHGYYKPIYDVAFEPLKIGMIVGRKFHTTPNGAERLIVGRVCTIWMYDKQRQRNVGYPTHVYVEPILHYWDKRKIDELIVKKFEWDVTSISCIFEKINA